MLKKQVSTHLYKLYKVENSHVMFHPVVLLDFNECSTAFDLGVSQKSDRTTKVHIHKQQYR